MLVVVNPLLLAYWGGGGGGGGVGGSPLQVMLHLPNQTDHIIKDPGNKAMTVKFGNDCSSNLETLRYNTLVKKNLQQPRPLFTLNVCHLHYPLSISTASEFTTKLWSAWVLMMVWML